MFKILINNKEIDYIGFRFTEKFNSLSNNLNVSIAGEYFFNTDDRIKLIYNNQILLNGFIDAISISRSGSNSTTDIDCRDITGDIIDSTMRVITRKANYNFLALIEEITSLKVKNTSNVKNFKIPFFVKSSLGENLADFLQKIAKHFKVFMSCGENGEILLNSLNTNLLDFIEINNYIGYNYTNNIQDSYNRYTCYSQTNFENNSILAGQVINKEVRNTRFYVFDSDVSLSTTQEAKELADRERQLREAKREAISITLPFNDKIIRVNTYAKFNNKIYFIDEISYNYSNTNKDMNIKLINKEVYL